jgi:DNA-binding PadR family transcriptional regulator
MDFDANLLRGSIDLVVLAALADEPRYGYALLKRIHDASAARHKLTAGTLYPILHRLERDGMVATRWEAVGQRRRKWYSLTDRGRKRLRADADEWREFVAYVETLITPALNTA